MTKKDTETKKMETMETSAAYQEGELAYAGGVSVEDNPYPSESGMSNDRYNWYMGWYDSKAAEKLAKWSK